MPRRQRLSPRRSWSGRDWTSRPSRGEPLDHVMKLPIVFRPIFAFALAGVALNSGCQNRFARPTRAPSIPANFEATAPAEPIVVDPALLQPTRFPYRLGPGDVLDIEVLGDVNTQTTTIVGPDGKIYFYILP